MVEHLVLAPLNSPTLKAACMAHMNDNAASHALGPGSLPMVPNTSPQHHQTAAGPRSVGVPHAAPANVNPLAMEARRNMGPHAQSTPPLVLPSPQHMTSRQMAMGGVFMPGGRVVPGSHLGARPPLASPMHQPGRPQGTAQLNMAAMNGSTPTSNDHQGYAVHSNGFVRPANQVAAGSSAAAAAVLVSRSAGYAGRSEARPQPPGQSPVKMPFARPGYYQRPASTAGNGSRPAMVGGSEQQQQQQKMCGSPGRFTNGVVGDNRTTAATGTNTSNHANSSNNSNHYYSGSSSGNNNSNGQAKVFRVPPVARGPQPQCVEPTRLPDGRRIKDVMRQRAAAQGQLAPKNMATGSADQSPRSGDPPALQPTASFNAQQNGPKRRKIRTTEGVDKSWMDGYTYCTWVDSPKWSLLSSHYQRVPRQHSRPRRRQDRSEDSESSERPGNRNMIDFFKNLLS